MLLKSCDTVQTEAEAKAILEPLVESGNSIYQEIMVNGAEVSPEDIAAIANPTDQQLAQLAVTYLAASNAPLSDDQKKIIICVATAFGIYGVIDAFAGTTVSLLTVESAVAILKAVAKRVCLGYIGTIWVIYGFLDCMGYLPN